MARLDPQTQTRTEIANIPADHPFNPPWVHDLPGTENFILVPDTPTVMDYGLRVSKFFQDFARIGNEMA